MTKKNPKENFLDFIPVKNPKYTWSERDNGLVVVTIHHNGFFDRVVQQIFRKPAYSRIDLDDYGSFVWGRIDGQQTVYDISQTMQAQFGAAAEPLLNRLVAYFGILKDHKFISYVQVSTMQKEPR